MLSKQEIIKVFGGRMICSVWDDEAEPRYPSLRISCHNRRSGGLLLIFCSSVVDL